MLNTAPCNVFLVWPGIDFALSRSIMELKHEQDRSRFLLSLEVSTSSIIYIKEGKKQHEASPHVHIIYLVLCELGSAQLDPGQ